MKRPLTAQLRCFIVLSVVIAWGTWIPALVWPRLPKLLPLVGLFGPALAAAFVGGSAGVRDLVARARRWRFPATWYAVAALLMPACYALAVRLEGALSGRDERGLWIGSPPAFLLASFVWLLVVTSGEEFGWRGFALPRLLALGLSPWSASLVLGVVWALWHLPLYLTPGSHLSRSRCYNRPAPEGTESDLCILRGWHPIMASLGALPPVASIIQFRLTHASVPNTSYGAH